MKPWANWWLLSVETSTPKKPHAASDRLHTYRMKRFASLVKSAEAVSAGAMTRFTPASGDTIKHLGAQRNLSQMSERIIKSLISAFEAMNDIRNNKSLAHDDPDLDRPGRRQQPHLYL